LTEFPGSLSSGPVITYQYSVREREGGKKGTNQLLKNTAVQLHFRLPAFKHVVVVVL
jgi:hypothetical protein